MSAGNWVFAVGNDWDKAIARTPVSGQVLVQQRVDTQYGDTYWVQSTVAPATANALVDIHDSSPTTDRQSWRLSQRRNECGTEMKAAPPGLDARQRSQPAKQQRFSEFRGTGRNRRPQRQAHLAFLDSSNQRSKCRRQCATPAQTGKVLHVSTHSPDLARTLCPLAYQSHALMCIHCVLPCST